LSWQKNKSKIKCSKKRIVTAVRFLKKQAKHGKEKASLSIILEITTGHISYAECPAF
jgi:hypothetical protein